MKITPQAAGTVRQERAGSEAHSMALAERVFMETVLTRRASHSWGDAGNSNTMKSVKSVHTGGHTQAGDEQHESNPEQRAQRV